MLLLWCKVKYSPIKTLTPHQKKKENVRLVIYASNIIKYHKCSVELHVQNKLRRKRNFDSLGLPSVRWKDKLVSYSKLPSSNVP